MSSARLTADVPAAPSAAYIPSSPRAERADAAEDQTPSVDGQVLTLAQCIKVALDRNPDTRMSWQQSRAAAAGVGQARSGYLPSADLFAGASRSDPVTLDSPQDAGPSTTYDAGFSVRYLLFDGGERFAGLKGAEAELLDANFRHNAALQDVALGVEEAYYLLLAAAQIESLAEQTVRQTQSHVDVARARYENGIVSKSDVLRAETEQAEADLEMVRARSDVGIARGRLANVMGISPSESFEVADLPEDPHRRELEDIKLLMAEAADDRPELRAALARVESSRAGVKAANARYWPEATLNAGYGWRDHTFVPELDEWFVGVGVALPLFDGLHRENSIRRAKAVLGEKTAEYDKLLQGVELEVWTAYSRLLEAGQAIDAAQALVLSAEENARLAEGEYKNGTGSIIEVTDAQTSRTSANVRLVQARLGWYTAMARVERAVGRTSVHGTYGDASGDDAP
jgi:TolC family type I secretion outer membrane protein